MMPKASLAEQDFAESNSGCEYQRSDSLMSPVGIYYKSSLNKENNSNNVNFSSIFSGVNSFKGDETEIVNAEPGIKEESILGY